MRLAFKNFWEEVIYHNNFDRIDWIITIAKTMKTNLCSLRKINNQKYASEKIDKSNSTNIFDTIPVPAR